MALTPHVEVVGAGVRRELGGVDGAGAQARHALRQPRLRDQPNLLRGLRVCTAHPVASQGGFRVPP